MAAEWGGRLEAPTQFMFYNFARPHSSLGKNLTPAAAAGISDHVRAVYEVAALLD